MPPNQLDKQGKVKIQLRGGSPFAEMKINKDQVYQEKKGFDFLKLLTSSSDEGMITLSVKPFAKLTEAQQLHLSMLPSSCLVNKRLLSFAVAFRVLAQRKLAKSEQMMTAP